MVMTVPLSTAVPRLSCHEGTASGDEQRHQRHGDDYGGGTGAETSDGHDDDEHAHHEGVGMSERQLGEPQRHQGGVEAPEAAGVSLPAPGRTKR